MIELDGGLKATPGLSEGEKKTAEQTQTDNDKTVKDANTPCSTFVKDVQYQCSGQDVQKRSIFNGCTGSEVGICGNTNIGMASVL